MAPRPTKARAKKATEEKKMAFVDANSFDKELLLLADKAKQQTWRKQAAEKLGPYVKSVLLIGLMAIYSNVSQLALSPVFGSLPSSIHHSKMVAVACFVGWSTNLFLERKLAFKPHLLLPVVAIYIPTVQFQLYKAGGILGPEWGAALMEALTIFPLMVLSTACVASSLDVADFSFLPNWLGDAVPGLGSYSVFRTVEMGSGMVLSRCIGTSMVNTRLGLEMVLAASYSLLAPSKLMVYAIPGLLHTAFFNTHVPTPMALARLNGALRTDGWAILDRKESRTGYVSVIESKAQGLRAMRCDHSLLGGEWFKVHDMPQFRNNKVAEPIYGVFAMLEAVRLVHVAQPVKDADANALIIGLGIGTTPAALITHGIATTVVEIDPVVHEFACKYFQLPANHKVVIDDAETYVAQLAGETATKNNRFDYIVHDVFTGGVEPVNLFTLEFLQSLHALLMPHGVVAINYAGDFAQPPPKIIVDTIRTVFPSCRLFREHPRNEDEFENEGHDFTNMVIFCTKQATAGGKPLTFREPVPADFLNSPARQGFLMPKHEVLESQFFAGHNEGILRRNETGKLTRYHKMNALGHWRLMRNVLPEVVWVNW